MLRPFFFLAGSLSVLSVFGATQPTVQICQFQNNKPAALSLTFDDGLVDHYTVVRPMLKDAGIPATFFIVPAWTDLAESNRKDSTKRQFMSWQQVAELSEDGHEIGNHSYSHRSMRGASEAQMYRQAVEPIGIIESKTGQKPVTFCFPGNARDEAALAFVMKHHINARTTQYSVGKNFEISAFEKWIGHLVQQQKWGVAMIHGILHQDNGYTDLPNGTQDFRAIIDCLQSKRQEIWIDTFANVSKYERLRDSSNVVWLEEGQRFTVETDLDTAVYDLPLTVEITEGGVSRLLNVLPNLPINVQGSDQ